MKSSSGAVETLNERPLPPPTVTGASPNTLVPHSILKERPTKQLQETRRSRRGADNSGGGSSPGTSPVQRVSFDKSVAAPSPSLSNRLAGLTDFDIQKSFQASLRLRRTSLPATSNALLINKAPLQSNVSEARGLVVDMLANRDLPPTVASCLRAVATLLNPQPPPINLHVELGLPMVVENPYSGEQLFVSAASKPRVSNITFSTVTSATGLPTIAAEPSRPRSSSYWKPHERDGSSQSNSAVPSGEASSVNNVHPTNNVGALNQNSHRPAYGQEINSQKLRKTPPESAPVDGDTANNDNGSSRSSSELGDDVIQTGDGTVFDTRELDSDSALARISEWGFPIFHLAERHRMTPVSRLAYAIFKTTGLFRIFKLSPSKFFSFFHALERGYWDIPYHNRLHAADVLHGCYYLTCHPVRAFTGSPSTPDSPVPPSTDSPLPVSESMSNLELMALYTAAAMHDYDHPGRTNAFLVASEDRKAILYNDRSVLENHHAAESWRLLCRTENAFIDTLDAAEIKRFRYLVLEYILATDLKQHFDIIMQFNEKAPDMDLGNESDRVLVAQVLIKFADINSPSKPYTLHRQWTERICEEFYEQGDEEKRLNMAVSPYMDRNEPSVAKLQDSFIAHIVNPLAVALNEVGLLPVLPGLEESELIINLKHNHQKWLIELERLAACETGNGSVSSSGNVSGGTLSNQTDTIEEEGSNGSPNHSVEASDEKCATKSARSDSVDSVVGVECASVSEASD